MFLNIYFLNPKIKEVIITITIIKKTEPIRIFCGFCVFQSALWQKNENLQMLEINRQLCTAEKKHG